MGRTTLNIDDPLLRRLKSIAAKKGITLATLVNQLLRLALSRQGSARPYEFKFGGWVSQLGPGVDICDRNSLFDLLDGR